MKTLLQNSSEDENQKKDEICKCGRDNTRLHCPKCGSFNTLATAKKNRRVIYSTGGMRAEEYQVHKCRKCGVAFDSLDRRDCHAPIRIPTKSEINDDILRKQLKFRVENGERLNENDRRMYKRLHSGREPEEDRDLYKKALAIKERMAATPMSEAQIKETERQQAAITTLNDHYADCEICMRALTTDKEDSICEDGKKLKLDCVRKDI